MEKRLFLKRKAIIMSLIVSFLICSVSTTNVLIQGSTINNIIEKENYNYYYEYNKIINLLKDQLKGKNNKLLLHLLNEIDNNVKNHFGDKFFEDFSFFYNQTKKFIESTELSKLEMLQILYEKIIPTHREIINIISGKKPIEEISSNLMNTLETFYLNSNKKQTDTDIVSMQTYDDPHGYWENYSAALDCWSYLGRNVNCFAEWHNNFMWWTYGKNNNVFTSPLAFLNYAFIIAALLVAFTSFNDSGLIAWAVLTVMLVIDFFLLTYFIRGLGFWNTIKWREVNIILHIVDKATGENITGLEHKCYLTSIDANNWPLDDYGLSVENDFNYTLKNALYSNMSIKSGWYYLDEKSSNEFTQPPPPPGQWKIIIPSQSGYYGRFEKETTDISNEKRYVDTIKLNNVPEVPNIVSGDHYLKVKEIGEFCASSTDPANDHIKYCFDWDDNTIIECTGLTDSGKILCLTHSWNEIGNYSVSVYAEDEFGAKSTWSGSFWVNVSE